MGHGKSSPKGKVNSNTGIPQETKKSQINNSTPKASKKEEMKNPRVSRRKENLKIRAEINEYSGLSLLGKDLILQSISLIIPFSLGFNW